MIEMSQPIVVRVASASIISALAFYNSFGTKELFLQKNFLRRAKALCQDVNWEIRKEMCAGIPAISQLLGLEQAQQELMPELAYLLDDEETDVKAVAISVLNILFQFKLISSDFASSPTFLSAF